MTCAFDVRPKHFIRKIVIMNRHKQMKIYSCHLVAWFCCFFFFCVHVYLFWELCDCVAIFDIHSRCPFLYSNIWSKPCSVDIVSRGWSNKWFIWWCDSETKEKAKHKRKQMNAHKCWNDCALMLYTKQSTELNEFIASFVCVSMCVLCVCFCVFVHISCCTQFIKCKLNIYFFSDLFVFKYWHGIILVKI